MPRPSEDLLGQDSLRSASVNVPEEKKVNKILKFLKENSIMIAFMLVILFDMISWLIPNRLYTVREYVIILNAELLVLTLGCLFKLWNTYDLTKISRKIFNFVLVALPVIQTFNMLAIIFKLAKHNFYEISCGILLIVMFVITILITIREWLKAIK